MTIEYFLNENDILQHYLYSENQSDEARKKRQKAKLIRTAILLIAGLLCLAFGLRIAALALFILAIARWFIFDDFEKKWVNSQFLKRIRANHADFLGSTIKMTIGAKGLTYQTSTNTSQIPFTEISEIIQVAQEYLFIQMQGGQGIVIPIHAITDAHLFTNEMAQIAKEHHITHKFI